MEAYDASWVLKDAYERSEYGVLFRKIYSLYNDTIVCLKRRQNMLVAVLIYLVIGSLLMGGIYLVNPEIISDGGLDDIFFTRCHTINYINGFIMFLAIAMIWLPVFIAVIIKFIADHFDD